MCVWGVCVGVGVGVYVCELLGAATLETSIQVSSLSLMTMQHAYKSTHMQTHMLQHTRYSIRERAPALG